MTQDILAAHAFRIAHELASHTLVWLCDDDQQAEAMAAAVAALGTGTAVFMPSSDALPGDSAPASPANVGQRSAALRQLGQRGVACILSGEAAARCYPPPDAQTTLLTLRVGDRLDHAEFGEALAHIGYFLDDRVDEPGEVALRGDIIDVFPAQADGPTRLDLADGRITAIRTYDPLTQRSFAECDHLEIEPARDGPDGDHCILDHLQPGVLGSTRYAEARRLRFIQLAQDTAAHGGKAVDAVTDEVWQEKVSVWSVAAPQEVEPLPRFCTMRSPLNACAHTLRPLMDEGRALTVVGSMRGLRFLRPRLEARLGMPFDTQIMPVEQGFLAPDRIVLAAGDLLGSRASTGDDAASSTVFQPSELHVDDIVIHEDHGVGRIAGLEAGPDGEEMIVLDYAGGARRLLAVTEADRLWRYGAEGAAVTLDRLDGSSWQKRRAAVGQAIAESAQTLRDLAQERAKLTAPVLDPDPAAYERFVAGFAFDETPDQARAIAAVRDDLASGRPMDRLVIGDVGYGKTEVALRAAALAALAGYQVVVAAPTTVLVRQHVETFQRRFAGTGRTVASLSRLSSAAEKKAIKAGLADGSISVVIGTGAVMGASVRYAHLGLVVIDEEQRFGARDKERLHGDGSIHVLTLSATPIPRSLQSALVGLQAVSVIATSPARRQPIATRVESFEDTRIRTALLREKGRGGQSFVVVPRIEDMAPLAERLQRLVPDLALVQAHGKMAAADMDAAMIGFAAGQGDILLATNIIEAGLDIPRANTMIVWRADRFGLAQLHQLRGRVGRGNRRGQVWLLTDGVAERTLQRLRTLATFDRLGAGFEISLRDLDMRGGGNLAGDAQAGHMKLIGVDLYQHLLEQALRGHKDEAWHPDLRLGLAGSLPADWIPEADVRLGLYGRLSRLPDAAAVDAFEEELLDRFGPLPAPAAMLIAQARLTQLAHAAGIASIDAGPAGMAFTLKAGSGADCAGLGMQHKGERWVLSEALPEAERMERLHYLLEDLAGA